MERLQKQDNFILIARDLGNGNLEKDVGFNLRDVSQIRFREMNDLEDALEATIRTYYKLGPA